MSGFQLGTPSGHQLGTTGGGTLGTAATGWTLDGTELVDSRPLAETATARTITLRWRVTSERELSRFQTLKRDEGKVAVLDTDDGGHTAVDRTAGSNTYTLNPPARREPLRLDRTVHVQRYEEDLISQTAAEWDVEVEFSVSTERPDARTATLREQADAVSLGDGGTLGEPGGLALGGSAGGTLGTTTAVPATAWGFETPLGTLATDRVDADVLGTGEDGVRRFELTARFEIEQATTFEGAYKRIRGSRVKEVPDAPNVMVDEVGGDVTVIVDAPDDQTAVSDGAYVITEWESTRINDRFNSISFTIAEK